MQKAIITIILLAVALLGLVSCEGSYIFGIVAPFGAASARSCLSARLLPPWPIGQTLGSPHPLDLFPAMPHTDGVARLGPPLYSDTKE